MLKNKPSTVATLVPAWRFQMWRSLQECRNQNKTRALRHDAHFLAYLRQLLRKGREVKAHFYFDARAYADGWPDIQGNNWQAFRSSRHFSKWAESGEVL